MISVNQLHLYKKYIAKDPDLDIDLSPYKKNGIYTDFSDEKEYHKFFGMNHSSLISAEASAYKYFYKKYLDHKPYESPAMDLGSYGHMQLLESHRRNEYASDEKIIEEIFAERPDTKSPRSTKDYKEWKKQQLAKDKTIIPKESIADFDKMLDRIYGHEVFVEMLRAGLKEKAVLVYDEIWDLYLRVKLDLFHPEEGWVLDFKTCNDISAEQFSKDIFNKKYFTQAAFYLRACRLKFGKHFQHYYWLASEKSPPYDCRLFKADYDCLVSGEALCEFLVYRVQKGYETLNFDLEEKVAVDISLPPWADNNIDIFMSNNIHHK